MSIDDVLAINSQDFENNLGKMHSVELKIKHMQDNNISVSGGRSTSHFHLL